jgi:hypothetical protein
MIWVLCTSLALAAPSMGVGVSPTLEPSSGWGVAGLVRGERPLFGARLHLVAEGLLGSEPGDHRHVGLGAGLAYPLWARAEGPTLALQGPGGVGWSDGARPEAHLRLFLDEAPRQRVTGRAGLGLGWSPGAPAAVAELGLRWGRAASAPGRAAHREEAPSSPAVPVSAAAPPSPLPLALQGTPEGSRVWVPHPVCAWVPASEAADLLAPLPPNTRVEVHAPGALPATVSLSATEPLSLLPAPRQGGLVVSVSPGDRLRVEGGEVPVTADGVAVLNVREGPVHIEVEQISGTTALEGAVAAGHTLWLQAPPPTALILRFAAGSNLPDDAAVSALTALPLDRYAWSVQGSYSPEGDPTANLSLAKTRAAAAVALLRAAGVPESQIDLLPPGPPPEGTDYRDLRAARLTPRTRPRATR